MCQDWPLLLHVHTRFAPAPGWNGGVCPYTQHHTNGGFTEEKVAAEKTPLLPQKEVTQKGEP